VRIGIITNLYPPKVLGGYEILCGQVVERLRERGHQVRVITSDWQAQGLPAEDQLERSLRLVRNFPAPPQAPPWRASWVWQHNYQQTSRWLRSFWPEVVLVFSQLRLTLGAARAAEDYGCPVLYSWNDNHPAGYLPRSSSPTGANSLKGWLRRLWEWGPGRRERSSSLRWRHSTCISERLRQQLLEEGFAPAQGSRVIHQGIPLERFPFQSPRALHQPVRLLYTGQLHPYKGVHTILGAMARLKPRWRLQATVAGQGPEDYQQTLRQLVQEQDLQVEFSGYLPQTELLGLYRESDVFIFPSIWKEPFGLTHLEAMASGLVVVSTLHGGQGEVFEDGLHCLGFESENIAQLSHQLERLLQDEELRGRLIHNARHLVEERLNLHSYVDQLEQWVKGALLP
jgi:glycogen(starch) synthase